MTADRPGAHSRNGLRAIALFEATKGVCATLVAGALAAIGPDPLQHELERVLARLGVNAERSGNAMLDAITPETLHAAIGIALIYACMRLLESWGLWRHRTWASWLGVIGAAAYVPFEIYALWQHPNWMTWGVFLLNLTIVPVLARDLHRRRGTV